MVAEANKPKISKSGVALFFALFSLAAGAAHAGSYTATGYYAATCGTNYNACKSQSEQGPTLRRAAGLINTETAMAQISANAAVCMAAANACMSNPKRSPSSPSGFIFEFRAYYPY
ncbi:hypothetical protein [Asticcacaulis sp. AND118]|uniref:hypothetical protein n=1 Tax=Asticcacaulis sp. AND118 TaxID=2840468 RepID=UPI001CFF750D|nr:hypothetical protein [Asticcacaulis sp. AND118]UDF04051.1 hypothetical protein LH365_03115 [Asticcacaulis sp. AND118]